VKRYSYDDAIALVREAPLNLPSPSRREEIRTAVLAMARVSLSSPTTGVRPPRRRIGVAVAMLAAAAAVLAFILDAPAAPHTHATVTAPSGAHFTHGSTAPDEIVRLTDGTIDVEVAPLHTGERFRVIIGDAEVEVRGTAFEVVASADRLVSVDVRHGKVEVRPLGRPAMVLVAGGAWRAEPPKRAERPAPVEEPPPPPPTEPAPKPRRAKLVEQQQTPPPLPPAATVAPARAPEELAYSDAWSAMRTKDFARAATSFARVMILAPDSGLAEDATFWQAVALARGHRRAQAITAFRDFLDAHPRSPHAGEGNTMLGWLLVDTNERAEAARRFRAAVDDPRKSVRDSARSGLEATAAVDDVRDDRQ
jgi:TolA-binding protein